MEKNIQVYIKKTYQNLDIYYSRLLSKIQFGNRKAPGVALLFAEPNFICESGNILDKINLITDIARREDEMYKSNKPKKLLFGMSICMYISHSLSVSHSVLLTQFSAGNVFRS